MMKTAMQHQIENKWIEMSRRGVACTTTVELRNDYFMPLRNTKIKSGLSIPLIDVGGGKPRPNSLTE